MAVTQKQIADMLGVNRASISKALAGSPEVSESLRRRVKALCDELDYRPNYHARSLLTNRTGVIAVLKQELRLSILLSDWVDCIQTAAAARGYRVRLEHLSGLGQTIAEGSADGFIAFHTPSLEQGGGRYIGNTERPIIFTDCSRAEFTHNAVVVDNYGASRRMVEYLAGLGHRRIAFFGFVESSGPCRDRLLGHLDACRAAGLPSSAEDTVVSSEWPYEIEDTYLHGERVLQLARSGVTAFACSSDINGVGVMKMLKRNGYSIPDSVSVTGFDDSLTARACEPSLTSVHQAVSEASRLAVDRLIQVRETGELAEVDTVLAEVVVRESVGPAPAR